MKAITLSFAMLFISMGAMAQESTETDKKKEKPTPEQRAQKYADKMQLELGIDDTQKQSIYDLRIEKMNKVKEIREANKGDKEAIKTQAKPVVKEFNLGMKEILNETQFEKYKELRKKERQRMKAAVEKRKASKNEKQKESPLEDDDFLDSIDED